MFLRVWMCISVALVACDSPEGSDGLDPRLSVIQEEVFTPSCALSSCHDAEGPEAMMDLSAGASHASLVNVDGSLAPVVRVIPGDPDGSLLVQAIEGTAPDPINQMPVGLVLEDEKIDVIRQWIEDGAAND
jgi:hypothetical protein